jgi:RNA-directed DNA polymerase
MTATAGAPSATIHWKTIIWSTVEYEVRRLQLRIAKAIKIGCYVKAKALQWLLTHSFYGKLSAINILLLEQIN